MLLSCARCVVTLYSLCCCVVVLCISLCYVYRCVMYIVVLCISLCCYVAALPAFFLFVILNEI